MKITNLLYFVGAMLLSTSVLFAQGPLTPPGAPAVTMKTLRQLEPRTPIASAPYTITTSGSYYLTTNLVSTGHGIIIQAENVSIDLMGFSLVGDGVSSDYGLYFDGDASRPVHTVSVYNGVIEGFYNGIRMEFARQNRIEDLVISKCTSTAILVLGTGGSLCSENRFSRCVITENTGFGIYLAGGGGAVDGNTIEDCTIGDNGNTGINLYGQSGSCADNRILNCTIRKNGFYGIGFTVTSNTVVSASSICQHPNYGIYMVTSCSFNTIEDCLIAKNSKDGIYCTGGSGNRFDRNLLVENSESGIETSSQKNLIVRNIAIGNTITNFIFDIRDTSGPIVTNTGALPTSGTATHPWANFSRP